MQHWGRAVGGTWAGGDVPGGRLTAGERRDIAAGLARGLTYAEIARRLERPTSTVTREIARNGGVAGYSAERAERATRSRSTRRRERSVDRAGHPERLDGQGATDRDAAAVRGLQETFTEVLMRTGLSRMPALVLTSLYLTDDGSLTAAELVQRLGVSPASVSKAITQLEAQELVRRQPDAQRRRDRYVIGDDLWYRSWLASARMNAAVAETARLAAGVLGPATPAGTRFEAMGAFLQHVGDDMVAAAERWRRDPPAPGGPDRPQ